MRQVIACDAVEASDDSGRSVTNLGVNATLCMRVPVESWPGLGDLVPANGQIDVPLYYYDETTGQWKRNAANGWLENTSRNKLAETQLADIRAGNYVGDVSRACWRRLSDVNAALRRMRLEAITDH